MASTVILDKQETSFVLFPKEVEEYFLKKEITIGLYPKEICSDQEPNSVCLRITSASQYDAFLNDEIKFWKENDPDQKLDSIVCAKKFQTAQNNFKRALDYLHSISSMENFLRQSVNDISYVTLSSQTSLATELLKHVNKSSSFISGFRSGILLNGTSNFSVTSDSLQGFYAAMEYRKTFNYYAESNQKTILEFKSNAEEATNNFSKLNHQYTSAFLEQEKRLESITKQANDYLTELDEKSVRQFEDAESRLVNMERAYREKLRLEAPAQYWAKLKKSYSIKGYVWFGVSGLFATAIIALLLIVLIKDIVIFDLESNWIENLKNSAIITIIASIGIYVLRLTTKMALSSHHLAGDARERENLSLFYLSLIEKGAVTDKERALILNALFSRSDTGLLKGDASPSMPSNIGDMIDIIKSTKP